jgi:hypothetical protein
MRDSLALKRSRCRCRCTCTVISCHDVVVPSNPLSLHHQSLQVHKQPPIHQQLRARNIAAQLTPQKHSRPSQIRRHTGAAQRNPPFHVLPLRIIREILVVELRPDGAGQQCVAADIMFPQGAGGRLDQREDARLGRGVVCLLGAADERRDARDADYRAAGGCLGRELARAGLDGVEGARQVGR